MHASLNVVNVVTSQIAVAVTVSGAWCLLLTLSMGRHLLIYFGACGAIEYRFKIWNFVDWGIQCEWQFYCKKLFEYLEFRFRLLLLRLMVNRRWLLIERSVDGSLSFGRLDRCINNNIRPNMRTMTKYINSTRLTTEPPKHNPKIPPNDAAYAYWKGTVCVFYSKRTRSIVFTEKSVPRHVETASIFDASWCIEAYRNHRMIDHAFDG